MRDNEALKSSSFAASLCMGGPIQTETQSRSHTLDSNQDCNFTDAIFLICVFINRAMVETVWLVVPLCGNFHEPRLVACFR